jgi:hypothetical protein
VKNVFVSDVSLFVPRWLRFVLGVVDSSDLPLNMSRSAGIDASDIVLVRNVIVRRCFGSVLFVIVLLGLSSGLISLVCLNLVSSILSVIGKSCVQSLCILVSGSW